MSAARALAQPAAPAPAPGAASFNLYVRGTPIGLEEISLSSTVDGWIIQSTGRFSPPVDLVIQLYEMRYTAAWVPIEMRIEATRAGQPFTVLTTFTAGSATSQVRQGERADTKTDPISTAPLVLPNNLFAGYEALAARLSIAAAGDELRVYIAPQAEIPLRVNQVTNEQIRVGHNTIAARRHQVAFLNPNGPYDAEIWVDDRQRLLRVTLPLAGIDLVRTDIVSSSTRLQRFSHPGDEDVRVPANGFALAATVTKPAAPAAAAGPAGAPTPRFPAVVLVPGSTAEDRDYTVSDIPVLGHLAGALADRGCLVVRYEKRGLGQSGGRAEAATLADYAEDVRAIVKYLHERKDVDRDRITVAGYDDGGWVTLIAASREKKIAAVALVASPGTVGTETVLEQQQIALARLEIPDTEREAKLALQRQINDAVVGRGGWDDVPPAVRRQADTPWFKSYLEFDPSAMIRRLRQPILVVHGTLDRDVPPHHAERLIELARARKQKTTADLVRLAGVTHLLAADDQSVGAPARSIAPTIGAALADWLEQVFGGT